MAFNIFLLYFQYSCMPPGPWGLLPYIGVGLQVNKAAPHLTFTKWNKQYGDVISFTLYGMRVVVISSDMALREAFITKHEHFSGKSSLILHVLQNNQIPTCSHTKNLI